MGCSYFDFNAVWYLYRKEDIQVKRRQFPTDATNTLQNKGYWNLSLLY